MSRSAEKDLRCCFPGTTICHNVVETSEDLESWVTLNAILLTQFRFFCAVDLCQWDILLLELCSSFFVLWSESLAVATPWSKDWRIVRFCSAFESITWMRMQPTFCEHQVVIFDKVIESILLQLVHIGCSREGQEAQGQKK